MKLQQTRLTDTNKRITDFVLDHLERKEVIWRKSWNELGLPKNISTGHIYKGWNSFLLNFMTVQNNFKTPYFITYKQAMDAGGAIRSGQKGFTVVYWAVVENRARPLCIDGNERYPVYQIAKFHTVFNIEQTEGIDYPKVEMQFRSHTQKIQACEKIIASMPCPPSITHSGDKAYYNKATDFISIPPVERFHSDEDYYKTLFHELAHSTGHACRLNRAELLQSGGFRQEMYCKEELIAELTAAFLCGACGIGQQTITNSAAYIQGWLNALRSDKRMILKAASQAQAAADYILGKARNPSPAESAARKTIQKY